MLQENDMYGLNLLVFDQMEMLIAGELRSAAQHAHYVSQHAQHIHEHHGSSLASAHVPHSPSQPSPCRGGGVQAAPAV
jgi:hypothetical protein